MIRAFLPIQNRSTFSLPNSAISFSAIFRILELKAPAKPLSALTTTYAFRLISLIVISQGLLCQYLVYMVNNVLKGRCVWSSLFHFFLSFAYFCSRNHFHSTSHFLNTLDRLDSVSNIF